MTTRRLSVLLIRTVVVCGAMLSTYSSPGSEPSATDQAEIVLDDFESPSSPEPWMAISPSDNPTSVALVPGSSGNGLALNYRFWRGQWEGSAGVTRSFDPPVSAAAIALRVRLQPGVVLRLSVTDDTGQTLEYDPNILLHPVDPKGFSPHVIALDSPARFHGGANDGVLHGAVHSLVVSAAILNQNGYDTPGEIIIDEVAALPMLTYDLDPFAPPAVPAPAELKSRPPLFGVNALPWEYTSKHLDLYKDAGLEFVRVDVFWNQTELQRKQYDFSRFDRLVADLKTRNMRAQYILLGSNPLYSDGGSGDQMYSPQSPASISAFADFAAAAAARFKGTEHSFEIWSEPDTIYRWFPSPNVAQYAALARETTARIHAVDPDVPVAVGSTSYVYFFYLDDLMRGGGTTGADALSVHPYGSSPPETLADSIAFLRKLREDALPGSTLPFWQTEWGFTATGLQPNEGIEAGQARQAIFIARTFLTCWGLGFPWITWSSATDQGQDPTHWFHNVGLLRYHCDDSSCIKPAYGAVQTLTRLTRNHTYVGALPTRPRSLHAMKFASDADTVVALWSDTAGSKVLVTMPAPATAVNHLGASLVLTEVGSRRALEVSEATGPVYLTFPSSSSTPTGPPEAPTGLHIMTP